MNFFKSKQRTPSDLVRSVREGLSRLDAGPAEARKRVRSYSLTSVLSPQIADYKMAPTIPLYRSLLM